MWLKHSAYNVWHMVRPNNCLLGNITGKWITKQKQKQKKTYQMKIISKCSKLQAIPSPQHGEGKPQEKSEAAILSLLLWEMTSVINQVKLFCYHCFLIVVSHGQWILNASLIRILQCKAIAIILETECELSTVGSGRHSEVSVVLSN